LAKKFVELDRGHPSTGPLGDQIIASYRDVNSADLDQVLSVLDVPTRAALTTALQQLGGGAAGHSKDLHDLLEHAPVILTDLGSVSTALGSSQADLPALLQRADQLAGSLTGREQQIANLVQELGTTAGALSVDSGQPLQDTIRGLPATLSDARASFDALNPPLNDLQVALATLQPGVVSLGQATPDLRGILREGITPLNQVPPVATVATPAVVDLTQTMADARPLAPALSEGLVDLALPVNTLAAYSPQVLSFFQRVESMVSTSASPDVHAARVGVALEGLSALTGGVLKDPLLGQDAYPAPGQADGERTASPLNIVPGGIK
jgi:phospholipid/cholesterol/gamma-HCH transport system substrate-binding protein